MCLCPSPWQSLPCQSGAGKWVCFQGPGDAVKVGGGSRRGRGLQALPTHKHSCSTWVLVQFKQLTWQHQWKVQLQRSVTRCVRVR